MAHYLVSFSRYLRFQGMQISMQLVRLLDHYTLAKLEKVPPITSKDIYHVINAIYHSWVDDVSYIQFACFKKPRYF